MADSPAAVTGALPGESPAQAKARLRRERAAAKSGASRLQQIQALQGGPPRTLSELEKDVPVMPAPTPPPAPATAPSLASRPPGTATPDPDEIDISQHHYTPAAQPRLPSPFAFQGNAARVGPRPSAAGPTGSEDPVMAMLQQMLGASGGSTPGFPPNGGSLDAQSSPLPPALATMLSAMQGDPSAEPPSPAPEQSSAWVWRLAHACFSFGLALYIVLQTPYTGSRASRNAVGDNDWAQPAPSRAFSHFFYLFATYQVVLQSSRYFVEKGQLQGTGVLRTVAGFLPPPYDSYIRTVGRYGVIWSTVTSDAMVVVFVLGAASWCRGAAVA